MLALAAALGRRKPGWRSTRLVSNWVGIYNQEATSVRDEILVKDIVPMFTNSPTQNEMFSKELTKTVGGISTAIQLRSDIQRITAETSTHLSLPVLQSIDRCIQNWISVAFCVDSLALKRVTFDSSGTTLECIARADTVHIIRSISALKKRFHPGRRCYALFHHALPNYPLAFIHIGLTSSLATSMSSLDTFKEAANPTHAMFYSVNSTNPAFRGLSLAPHLIKEVVKVLQKECPTVKTFSTLSPIPNFIKWLSKSASTSNMPMKHIESIHQAAAALMSADKTSHSSEVLNNDVALAKVVIYLSDKPMEWGLNTQLQEMLKEPLMWLACSYITTTKESKGGSKAVIEPVGNFHMGNGAVFHRVNWMGNPGLSGLRASAGLMVNYLYDLPALENNKEVFREQPQQQQNSDRAGGSVLEEAAASELPHLALGDQVKSILLDN